MEVNFVSASAVTQESSTLPKLLETSFQPDSPD